MIGEESATRIRRDQEFEVDPATGLPEDNASQTETEIAGTVDPMDQEELDTLVGGDRNAEGIELLTKTELRTGDEQDGVPPDYVRLRSKVYEVRGVVHYSRVIPHYEAKLVRRAGS